MPEQLRVRTRQNALPKGSVPRQSVRMVSAYGHCQRLGARTLPENADGWYEGLEHSRPGLEQRCAERGRPDAMRIGDSPVWRCSFHRDGVCEVRGAMKEQLNSDLHSDSGAASYMLSTLDTG